jgi:hypothetical protein
MTPRHCGHVPRASRERPVLATPAGGGGERGWTRGLPPSYVCSPMATAPLDPTAPGRGAALPEVLPCPRCRRLTPAPVVTTGVEVVHCRGCNRLLRRRAAADRGAARAGGDPSRGGRRPRATVHDAAPAQEPPRLGGDGRRRPAQGSRAPPRVEPHHDLCLPSSPCKVVRRGQVSRDGTWPHPPSASLA